MGQGFFPIFFSFLPLLIIPTLLYTPGVTHIESSAGPSARTTAAATPIGSR
jgi:hypothetical protein